MPHSCGNIAHLADQAFSRGKSSAEESGSEKFILEYIDGRLMPGVRNARPILLETGRAFGETQTDSHKPMLPGGLNIALTSPRKRYNLPALVQ